MQIPVLVEPTPGNGFRARAGEPFLITAEGQTRDEALRRLSEQFERHLTGGVEVVALEVPPKEHPWVRFAGTLKDDPLLDEWKQAMAEYRQERDRDLDAP